MATLYARQQTSSYATLKRKGASVTFTATNAGTYAAATDTYSGATTSTVAGYAVAIEADAQLYRTLELIAGEAKTLLFGSSTAGSLPSLGMTVSWGSVTFTVKHVEALDPDGTAILGYVTVAR